MNRPVLAALFVTALAAGWSPPLARDAAASQATAGIERARAVLPEAAARALERVLDSARDQGLPTEPLVDKALEGAAKRVPPDRVISVVQELAAQLGRARSLLPDAEATPADITAVADALRRGVPEDAVRSLHAAIGDGEPVALAVHTLADLLERGVPVQTAVDVLAAWRGHGARPEELRGLPAAVERLIREGVLPDQAAAAVASAVRAGNGLGKAWPPDAVPPGAARSSPARPPIPPGAGPPGGHPAHGKGRPGHRPPGSGHSADLP
ncbi:MAG TPA: hypothetical protein VF188_17595 [Longimicrobiales bacterium]